MGDLKLFLRKVPFVNTIASKGYAYVVLRCRYLKYLLIGTKVSEEEWATRHLREVERRRDDWIDNCWSLQKSHSHRSFLIEAISKFNPTSVLEIGCNYGPNLRLLNESIPGIEMYGVDINPLAIQKGNEWLLQNEISNIKLLEGKADELGQFQDKSFDVVFTDAVLIYIGPDKIETVIKDLIRITRKALILVEWYNFGSDQKDPSGHGIYYKGLWKRNYMNLIKQFAPEDQINVMKFTEDMWQESNWNKVGALIEVKFDLSEGTFINNKDDADLVR